MINYDPDGGDLGRASIKPISALELKIVIPHIADILHELSALKISTLPFKYAFELLIGEREFALYVIETSRLPPNVMWYELDGKKLFEMRSASGGVTSSVICYLVTK